MNIKGRNKKNQAKVVNIFEKQEVIEKAEVLRKGFKAHTWRELETKGKFRKNEKLSVNVVNNHGISGVTEYDMSYMLINGFRVPTDKSSIIVLADQQYNAVVALDFIFVKA